MSNEKQSLGLNEFLAGCMGGFTQVILGQPFDIVKVRLQTQKIGETLYSGATDCLQNIIKNEGGALALWKGSLPPLLGVGAATSIQFGVNENTKFLLKKYTHSKELSPFYLTLCGAIAGIANSVISTPAEHIRIRVQSQGTHSDQPYRGSIDWIRKIYREHGFKGLYKGGVPTVVREAIAYAVYFCMYELVLRAITEDKKHDPGIEKIAFSGAAAGICFWFAVFPIDVVKTKIQTDCFIQPKYKGAIDCARKTYKSAGWTGFWGGLAPCLMRAIPANGGSFVVYDETVKLLQGRKVDESFY